MDNRPIYDPSTDALDQALARRLHDHSVEGGADWASFSARQARNRLPMRRPQRWIGRTAVAALVLGVLVAGGWYLWGWNNGVEQQAWVVAQTKLGLAPESKPLPGRPEYPALLAHARPTQTSMAPLSLADKPIATPEPESQEAPKQEGHRSTARPKERPTSPNEFATQATQSKRTRDRKLRIGAYTALGTGSGNAGSKNLRQSAVAMDYAVGKYQGNQVFDPSELKHDFPVSVGVSLDIPLVPRLRLSTGLMYTYVRSSASASTGVNYNYEQEVHYLGIPVSVAYDFFVSRPVDLYVTGGTAVEWAVASKGRSEVRSITGDLLSEERKSLGTQGVMVSFNVGLGVGVRLSPRVGLYAEPGVTGYLPNDSHPITFRTTSPVQFSLRAGIRVKL